MTVLKPLFVGALSHPERDVRLGLLAAMGAPTATLSRPGGVVPGFGGELTVTQSASPALTVQVASGAVVVPGTVSPTQGSYMVVNDAPVTLSFASAHASLPRVDLVVARVKDDDYGDPLVNAGGYLEVVTGTANAVRTAPAVPANAVRLFEVDIAALSTAILTSHCVDVRAWSVAVGGTHRCKAGTRPGSPHKGMKIFEEDTGLELVWTGSLWRYVPFKAGALVLSRTGAQSIPHATSTDLSWTTTFRNVGGISPALPATVFTCPASMEGDYQLSAYVPFTTDPDGAIRVLQLFVNGASIAEDRAAPFSAFPTSTSLSLTWPLNGGDQVKVQGYQDGGGSLALTGFGLPRFCIQRLAEK
jgi:hypothetical protein